LMPIYNFAVQTRFSKACLTTSYKKAKRRSKLEKINCIIAEKDSKNIGTKGKEGCTREPKIPRGVEISRMRQRG